MTFWIAFAFLFIEWFVESWSNWFWMRKILEIREIFLLFLLQGDKSYVLKFHFEQDSSRSVRKRKPFWPISRYSQGIREQKCHLAVNDIYQDFGSFWKWLFRKLTSFKLRKNLSHALDCVKSLKKECSISTGENLK